MVQGQYISGGGNFFTNFVRAIFVVLAAVGGFFLFAASAAFALIVTGGLLILGFVIFCGLWLRAKILGKPLMPKMQSYSFGPQGFGSMDKDGAGDSDGPVLDAHQTPDGWSVDRD